ncbi:MAG: hypothetical protein AAGA56_07810 [Myxococcota bacterium]
MARISRTSGTIVLAASVAAAFTACGDDEGGTLPTPPATTADTETQRDSTTDEPTTTTTEDGGGGTGPRSDADRSAAEVVELRCPDPNLGLDGEMGSGGGRTYAISEGTDGADGVDVFDGLLVNAPEAYVFRSGNDDITLNPFPGAGPRPFDRVNCMVGGPTNDTVRVTGQAEGTGDVYEGTAPTFFHFFGGAGSDTVIYLVQTDDLRDNTRPAFTFRDFATQVDKIQIDFTASQLGDNLGAVNVRLIDDFNPAVELVGNCLTSADLVLDAAQGDLWLATSCEGGVLFNTKLAEIEGDTPVLTDIEVVDLRQD